MKSLIHVDVFEAYADFHSRAILLRASSIAKFNTSGTGF